MPVRRPLGHTVHRIGIPACGFTGTVASTIEGKAVAVVETNPSGSGLLPSILGRNWRAPIQDAESEARFHTVVRILEFPVPWFPHHLFSVCLSFLALVAVEACFKPTNLCYIKDAASGEMSAHTLVRIGSVNRANAYFYSVLPTGTHHLTCPASDTPQTYEVQLGMERD